MSFGKKVLVTGFEPFLGEPINPSAMILTEIRKNFEFSGSVETLLLPVSFSKAAKILSEKIVSAKETYQVVLMLGQAGGRKRICLERVALNWIETEHPDEDGVNPSQGRIDEIAAAAFFSTAPVSDWKSLLASQGLPVEVSLSAGGYVCNYLYFKALQLRLSLPSSPQMCFIHVPYLPEQVLGKPAENGVSLPSLPLNQMVQGVELILKNILKGS